MADPISAALADARRQDEIANIRAAKDSVINRQRRQIMRLQKALRDIVEAAKVMRERTKNESASDYLHGRADGSDDCAVIARNALADQIDAL